MNILFLYLFDCLQGKSMKYAGFQIAFFIWGKGDLLSLYVIGTGFQSHLYHILLTRVSPVSTGRWNFGIACHFSH